MRAVSRLSSNKGRSSASANPEIVSSLPSGQISLFGPFQSGFARPLPWPPNAKAVPDWTELQLALCDSEAIAKSVVAHSDGFLNLRPQPVERIVAEYLSYALLDTPGAESLRTYRNAIMAVAPDASGLEKAIQRMQRWMAAEAIEDETPNTEAGKLAREQLKKQRPEIIKALKLEAARTFNRLVLADGATLTIDERFIVPPDTSPLKLPLGQDAVRSFVEDRKLIYGPEDSLDPDYFIDRVFKGAVPHANQPEARSTAALQKRFLAAQGLRLVADPSVIRTSILRALEQGRLVRHRIRQGRSRSRRSRPDAPARHGPQAAYARDGSLATVSEGARRSARGAAVRARLALLLDEGHAARRSHQVEG